VVVVPGNHERSRLPYPLLLRHPCIYVVDRPRSVTLEVRHMRVAIAGFPYYRHGIARSFPGLVASTGLLASRADIRLLCLHQCIEGARVGPVDYEFRSGPDVVRARDVPRGIAAVLAGHVHRRQELSGMRAPVVYSGSVERTSFAERGEDKGYMLLDFAADAPGGRLAGSQFVELPCRPMLVRAIDRSSRNLETDIRRAIETAPPDAVLGLRLGGREPPSAGRLRALTPPTMNVRVIGQIFGLRTNVG
jgi:DNA repair exonuclease SbcCD nuclease subunit